MIQNSKNFTESKSKKSANNEANPNERNMTFIHG